MHNDPRIITGCLDINGTIECKSMRNQWENFFSFFHYLILSFRFQYWNTLYIYNRSSWTARLQLLEIDQETAKLTSITKFSFHTARSGMTRGRRGVSRDTLPLPVSILIMSDDDGLVVMTNAVAHASLFDFSQALCWPSGTTVSNNKWSLILASLFVLISPESRPESTLARYSAYIFYSFNEEKEREREREREREKS